MLRRATQRTNTLLFEPPVRPFPVEKIQPPRAWATTIERETAQGSCAENKSELCAIKCFTTLVSVGVCVCVRVQGMARAIGDCGRFGLSPVGIPFEEKKSMKYVFFTVSGCQHSVERRVPTGVAQIMQKCVYSVSFFWVLFL